MWGQDVTDQEGREGTPGSRKESASWPGCGLEGDIHTDDNSGAGHSRHALFHQDAHFKCTYFVYVESQLKNKFKRLCEDFKKGPVNRPPYLMTNNLLSWNVFSNAITQHLQTLAWVCNLGTIKLCKKLHGPLSSGSLRPYIKMCFLGLCVPTPVRLQGTVYLKKEIWGYHPPQLSFHDTAEPRKWSFKKVPKRFWAENTSLWEVNWYEVRNNWYLRCSG